jgi:hypothetical protein
VKQESGGLLLLRRITPRSRAVMRSIFTLALIPQDGNTPSPSRRYFYRS